MRRLFWFAGALWSCANAGGAPEPMRRPPPPVAVVKAQPKTAAPVEVAAPPAPPPPQPLVIVAGGDVSFAREVGQRLLREPDFAPFAGVQGVWADADVRFVNLESQLSFQNGETQSPNHRLIFTGPPEGAPALARAGITLVSTANNHAWDYGRGALLETLDNLQRAGVQATGTGRDLDSAWRAVSLRIKSFRVAFLAVTQVWNQGPIELHAGRDHVAWANIEQLKQRLAGVRSEHDLVVLSYHGGAEYQDAPADVTRRFVEAAFDAGVDVVIGHHPHVIQGISLRRNRPAFFSLGNLVFGPRFEHPWTRYGMLARIVVTPEGSRSYSVCPYRIEGFTPRTLDPARDEPHRSRFLHHVKIASTAVGGIRLGTTDELGCTSIEPAELTRSPVAPPRVDPTTRPLAQR